MKVIMSTAYWPNLLYFSNLINADEVIIEQHENYTKQTYRNRTEILSANGVLALTIPVVHAAPKQQTKDVLINYRENWQIRHWRAITSAYRNSPYFEFFEEEIKSLYTEKTDGLLDYNLKQLLLVRKILKGTFQWKLSDDYHHHYPLHTDLRDQIHPKKTTASPIEWPAYYQTFGGKFAFVQNLSTLDLIFNTGLATTKYLADLKVNP